MENTDKNILNKIRAGMVVKVREKKDKGENIFEGLVISRKHGKEPGATFTVRRVSNGMGIEKTYPIYSPLIKVQIIRENKVRKSKLYWVRKKSQREIRKKLHL